MSDWKNVQYKDGKMRTSEGGGGGGSSTFAGLDDVNFSNLQNGQVPKYNSTTHKWENANESGGGGTVTDVTVDGTSVVNPQGVAEIETPDADGIEYDNQQSGLSATDVQSAIDELAQGSGGGGVEDVEVNGTSVVNAQNVAEITSYKEVTLAEYQALPSSKLTDNILYCIKDSAGADGFPPLIYSDEEREVGVWTDGKPIYCKAFNIGSINRNSNVQVDVSALNIDKIVSCVGGAYSGNYNQKYPMPFAHRNNGSYAIEVQIVNTNTTPKLVVSSGTDMPVSECEIALYYTKTTDVAGSGTWNQQGAISHHYSTTEKVIGTWIDGKPLYEKTLTGLSIALSWNNQYRAEGSFANAPTNVDALVNIFGDGINNNNKVHYNLTAYNYGSNTWLLCGLDAGTISTLVIQYTKTTD